PHTLARLLEILCVQPGASTFAAPLFGDLERFQRSPSALDRLLQVAALQTVGHGFRMGATFRSGRPRRTWVRTDFRQAGDGVARAFGALARGLELSIRSGCSFCLPQESVELAHLLRMVPGQLL